jgi:hypothetical protein
MSACPNKTPITFDASQRLDTLSDGSDMLDYFVPENVSEELEIRAQVAEKKVDELTSENTSLIKLVADIRFALGDNGKRMQPELIEYCKELVKSKTEGDRIKQEVQRLAVESKEDFSENVWVWMDKIAHEVGAGWVADIQKPTTQ